MKTAKRNRKENYTRTIGFRLEREFAPTFDSYVVALGVKETELARAAFRYGFKAAVEEITKAKQKEAESLLIRLKMVRGKGLEPLTPTVSR
jgi:hypothetical protein